MKINQSNFKNNNSLLLGIVLFSYLMVTLLLFEFGPWPWPVTNKVVLYLYIITNNLVLLISYVMGLSSSQSSRENTKFLPWFKTALLLSVILFIPTSLARTGLLFPNLVGAFQNLGEAYFQTREVRLESNSVIEYIRILVAPFLFSLYPLTIYYWGELNKRYKVVALSVCLGYLLISINMGINKLIVDYLIIFIALVFIKKFIIFRQQLNLIQFLKRLLLIFTFLIFFFQFINYFQSTQISRVGDNIGDYNYRANIYSDRDVLLVRFFPEEVKTGIIQLSSYITQGYYGLSLAMKEDFTWTYGVGSSIFIMKNVESLFDINIEERTYPFKTIKYGWDPLISWSSIYPWLASDLTFLGVFIFIAFVGYLLGLALKDIINNRNFLAIPSLSQLILLIFYIPANNQMMQSGEAFFAFFITLFLWLFSRKYKVLLKNKR